MAKITIKGDTSGEVDIVVPAEAGSTTYNLSTSGGNVLSDNDIGTTVQGYDADTAKLDTAQTWTATQTYGDNVKQQFGASSDLQIYHDGSNSRIQDLGTGSLKIQSNGTGVDIATTTGSAQASFVNNGASSIYYNGAVKLATTSTGVSVTGTCSATSFSGDGSALTGISTNPYTAQSLSGSGYITLVGGLKINWVTTGTTTATSGTTGFTWASAFTTIYGAVVSQSLGTDSGEIGVNKSTTGGTVDFYAWSGGSKQWTIIGIGV